MGIVRLSGPAAVDIADQVFRSARPGRKLATVPSHLMIRGTVVNAEGALLDDCLAVRMQQPNSYTGEDVVEFHCHGSQVVLRSLLAALLSRGARAAAAGEFTRRAFVNGKLDLVQVEAVGDLVEATSEAGAELAVQQLAGALCGQFAKMQEKLMEFLAHVHAAIDYPDEVPDPAPEEWVIAVQGMLNEVLAMLEDAERGIRLREGIKAVIVGKPNVGKSSLLNALLRMPRAIVTEVAGTTRDVIEESIQIGGVAFRLSDTAGLHETSDVVESQGVTRTWQKLAEADLVLAVFDVSQPMDDDDAIVLSQAREHRCIAVWNKSDLPGCLDEATFAGVPVVRVSARSGAGLHRLENLMAETAGVADDRQVQRESRALLSRPRQIGALRGVAHALRQTLEGAAMGLSPDCLAAELEEGLWHLGELTGETTPDEIVNEIFQRFCVGK